MPWYCAAARLDTSIYTSACVEEVASELAAPLPRVHGCVLSV